MLLKTVCKSTFCGFDGNCSYWKVQYLGHVEETRLWPGTLLPASTSWSTFSRAIKATPALCSEAQKPHGYSAERKLEARDKHGQKICCAFNLDFVSPLRSTKQLRQKDLNRFPAFWEVNNNAFTCSPCLLSFLFLWQFLPHPRFDFRDVLTNIVFSAQLKSSAYWETPPLNRRCFRVNEG